jgi:hypothetical protein
MHMKKNPETIIPNIKQSRSILLALVGTALLICAAIVAVYVIQQKNSGSEGGERRGDLTNVLSNFCGKTVRYPSEWSTNLDTDDARGSCTGVSFFTYHRDEVVNELKSDGRYPTNANYFNDIKDRKLVSYPYSLDAIYEIQLEANNWSGKHSIQQVVDSMTVNPFSGNSQEVSGLRTYSLKDREVADYIRPGEGDSVAQRIILIADKNYQSGYILTINRSESSLKIDQSKIDKLSDFIASLELR